MWPFKRRGKRKFPAVDEELAQVRVARKRLELSVAKNLADQNPELAARYLLGKGAVLTAEKSLAERFLEAKLLRDDDDGLDKLERLHTFYARKREEMGLDDERDESPFERALERFGGPVIQAIAAAVNPSGYQQALAQVQAAQQQQPLDEAHQVVTEVSPRRGGPQVPQHAFADLEPQTEDHRNVVHLFQPINPPLVLANLAGMPPPEFARWALQQPSLAEHMRNLATSTDEQLASSLASMEQNPFFGGWREVFGWLRANPERTGAIVTALRQLLAYQTEDPDDIAL